MGSSLRSLNWLNTTQFLGAANDNLLKFSMVFLLIETLGKEAANQIQTNVGICFVLPFLLFSPFAGFLADRFSKQRIMVVTKAAEIAVTVLAFLAFQAGHPSFLYGVLFLMASHSAFFGPSKYGSIPELVPAAVLSRANGLINGFTYLAIIFGTLTAPLLTDWLQPRLERVVLFCIAIAAFGFLASRNIEKTAPADPEKRWQMRSFFEIGYVLKRMWLEPRLIHAIGASTFFWFLGAFVQIAIIPYGLSELNIPATESTYLYLMMAIGIGIGSLGTGYLSGSHVRLNLIPIGVVGMMGTFALLAIPGLPLLTVYLLLFLLGIGGGIFIVPVNTYIQRLCPRDRLGEVMAAENFLSFTGILLAALMFGVFSQVLKLTGCQGFLGLGVITLLYACYLGFFRSRFHGLRPLNLQQAAQEPEILTNLPENQ